jgi:hypothetical protein
MNQAQDLLEAAIGGVAPLEATDHLSVVHRLWPVSDERVIREVIAAMSNRPVYIADGHHRYETALALREELAGQSPLPSPPRQWEGTKPSDRMLSGHPANFVLMTLVSMSDPGMIVLPTHRLFRGLPPIASGELIEKLGRCFDAHIVGQSSSDAAMVWAEIECEGIQGCMAFFTAKDQKWIRADITDAGMQRMSDVAAEHSPDWQGLGVSILHRLLIDTLLDGAKLPAPKYVREISYCVLNSTPIRNQKS